MNALSDLEERKEKITLLKCKKYFLTKKEIDNNPIKDIKNLFPAKRKQQSNQRQSN